MPPIELNLRPLTDQVKELLQTNYCTDPSQWKLPDTATIDDYGLDSIERVEFGMELEKQFDVCADIMYPEGLIKNDDNVITAAMKVAQLIIIKRKALEAAHATGLQDLAIAEQDRQANKVTVPKLPPMPVPLTIEQALGEQ